jgi:uncharacterized RDD family membrane protein YckC
MHCSSCGASVAEGTAFCGSCGRPIVGFSVAPPLTQSRVIAPAGMAAVELTNYAGFWLRVVAHIIDSLVAGVVFGVIAAIALAAVGVGSLRDLGAQMAQPNPVFPTSLILGFVALILFLTIVSWLYFAGMESSIHQATLGKMALSLVVTDMQGNRIGFGRASARFFSKIITGLIPFGIGYLMAGFTEKKQALHDMIATCLVLRNA